MTAENKNNCFYLQQKNNALFSKFILQKIHPDRIRWPGSVHLRHWGRFGDQFNILSICRVGWKHLDFWLQSRGRKESGRLMVRRFLKSMDPN